MNVNQLRMLVAIVEHGSFSEAARVAGVSQPAASMQIQSLEADLGVTLLERRYRHVELTDAGRALLPHARAVIAQMETARDEIERLADTVSGHLVLVASTTPGQYVLPRLLGSFLRAHPEVSVSLHVTDTAEVVRLVDAGEAHLGMTGAELPNPRVRSIAAGTDRLVLVAGPASPLAGRTDLTLADVVEQPFIVREEGSGTRMVVEQTMRAAGVDPEDLRVVMELGTCEGIVSAVEGGMGVGVVSHWMADKALTLGTIVEVRTLEVPVERPLYIVTPEGAMRRAAEALLDHLQSALAQR